MFHPLVASRVEDIGKTYEKIAHSTIDAENAARQLLEDTQKLFPHIIEANNRQLVLEENKLLTLDALEQRMKLLDEIAEATKEFQPLFSTLVYATKPYIDGIYAFKDILVEAMKKLVSYKDNEQQSVEELNKLGKKFDVILNDHHLLLTTVGSVMEKSIKIAELCSHIKN